MNLVMPLRSSLKRLAPFGAKGPASVSLIITHRCNQRCVYCSLPERPAAEMTTAQIKRLIDEFRALGTYRFSVSGGEPLLREDLPEIIGHAKARGLLVNVNTNGALLPARIDALKELALLVVSLDGPAPMHEANRGAGTFASTMAGLEAAQRAGLRTAAICVLTSRNLPALFETLTLAAELGVRLLVQPVTPCELSGSLPQNLLPPVREFHDAVRRLLAEYRRLPLGVSRTYLKYLLRYPDFSGAPCRAGRDFVTVTPDGRLTPCYTRFIGDFPSAAELGAAEAWRRLPPPSCRGCAVSPYMEANFIARLKPGSLRNALRLYR